MREPQKWKLAMSRFNGYYANIPPWLKAEQIADYHSIVTALEEASGEDLSHFKIPPDKIRPKIISIRPGGHRYPGSAQYSQEGYCDSTFFQGQIDGLKNYLHNIQQGAHMPTKYDTLSDAELDKLMVNRRIKPDTVIENGKVVRTASREYIIAALVKQDAPAAPIHSTTYNVFDSNFIQGSPGASVSANVGLQKEEFKNLIEGINQLLQSVDFKQETKEQISTDIGTIQLHLNSPRPNPSIIRESLNSLKTILGNTAGSVCYGFRGSFHHPLSAQQAIAASP
jgi:hypothetical protein